VKPSLPDLFSVLGNFTADAIGNLITLGVSLGTSIADLASQIGQALMETLYRALTIASETMIDAFRDAVSAAYQATDTLSGWVWTANLGSSCLACTAMHGTVHPASEDMESHVGCQCIAEPLTPDNQDEESGVDWFDSQDEATQRDILGNARYDLYQNGVSLQSMMGTKHDPTYGRSLFVKPLKELTKARR